MGASPTRVPSPSKDVDGMLYPDRQRVTYAAARDRVSPGTVRTKVDNAVQQDACITHA